MIKQRLITASILILLVASLLFYFPPIAWSCFMLIIIALASWEWFGLLALSKQEKPWPAIVYALFSTALVHFAGSYVNPNLLLTLAIAATCWGSIAIVRYSPQSKGSHSGFSYTSSQIVLSLCLLAPFLLSVETIFHTPKGSYILLAAASVIWINDSMAFVVGKAFGKRKLIPAVSPNKTWEGFAGGLIFAVAWGVIMGRLLWPHMPHPYLFGLLVTLLAVFANIGDLIISLLKRLAGKKDCSQLLPGHGGILDRIDSLLTGIPLFALGLHMLGLISY